MASCSFSPKFCFNSNCKQLLLRPRKGWRRRTGDYADLCDPCASVYEEGNFCESFHTKDSGWRSCESCGKTPNPAWPPSSLTLHGEPNKIKDISVKNWNSIAASGPVPWRQAPSLFNLELHPKKPFELDIPSGVDGLLANERLSDTLDKQKNEDSSGKLIGRSMETGGMETGVSHIFEKGLKFKERPSSNINATQQLEFVKNEPSTPDLSLTLNPTFRTETLEQTKFAKSHTQQPTLPLAAEKQFCSSNGAYSLCETQSHIPGLPVEIHSRNQLRPRYMPGRTDLEPQQLCGDSNFVATPLFEKMLTATDVGKIGRLVLPKKCAEAFFPPISNSEGIPLMVQDSKGKDWVFQFRFWSNNNSRMYVLEGVAPCIQSLKMQAGDRVTFSRLEPGGKWLMGCIKASSPSDQCKQPINTSNGGSTCGEATVKVTRTSGVVSAYRHSKGNQAVSRSSLLAVNKANSVDAASIVSKVDPSSYINGEVFGAQIYFPKKRKCSSLAYKSKRVRINNDILELKITWGQAQLLFRPPPSEVPKIVMIEGHEIEEFEEPPIIGRPTFSAEDHVGDKVHWVQCEDCFKWRKVPGDFLLPARWTCSKNVCDPQRSCCAVAQELSPEELKDLLSTSNQAGTKEIEATSKEQDSIDVLEGLDALAYLAIQEEGDAQQPSSLATTKHPRHRPGCSCIVCIQPPSGRGPKHKPTCACNFCLTVKRRFQTLTLRREKKQSEKEAAGCQNIQQPEQLVVEEIQPVNATGTSGPIQKVMSNEIHVDDSIDVKSSTPTLKGRIDLNIQPERDFSPVPEFGRMMNKIRDEGKTSAVDQTHLSRASFGSIFQSKMEDNEDNLSFAGKTNSAAGSQMLTSGIEEGNLRVISPFVRRRKQGDWGQWPSSPTFSATNICNSSLPMVDDHQKCDHLVEGKNSG